MTLARNPLRRRTRCPIHPAWPLWMVLCAAFVSTPASSISAQSIPTRIAGTGWAINTFQRTDSLLAAGAAAEALSRLEEHLDLFPQDVEAHWRAAKAATLVGLLSPILIEARPDYRAGIAHADKALKLEPDHLDALTWSMMSKGRLALWTGIGETADLAQDVWEVSRRLLAENDENAWAHHALGVLHYQVRSMGRIRRFFARTFVGGDALSKATWELAMLHLERSVALDPFNKLFRLAYAEALAKRGREHEALVQAEIALAQPVTDPVDGRHHYLIQRLVRRLG